MHKSISIMIKPNSGNCNYNCEYCFYAKELAQRKQGDFGIMTIDTARNIIKKAIEYVKCGNISFVFQGGEPTLIGLNFYKEFIKMVNMYRDNCHINYFMQTNASLINNEWADFLVRNKFLLGVSLDGDSECNKARQSKDNQDSYTMTLQGIEILQHYKVDFNVLSVITAKNYHLVDKAHDLFIANGWKYLQFIVCLDETTNQSQEVDNNQNKNNIEANTKCKFNKELNKNEFLNGISEVNNSFDETTKKTYSPNANQYEVALDKLFEKYCNDYKNGKYTSVRLFDNWVNMYLGKNNEQCGLSGYCSQQFVIEANGNIYPCDFYCIDEWELGNINNDKLEDIANSNLMQNFLNRSYKKNVKCLKCEFYTLCRGGGCYREKQSMDYCNTYYNFFKKNINKFKIFDNLK